MKPQYKEDLTFKNSVYNKLLDKAYKKGEITKEMFDTYSNATVVYTKTKRFPVVDMGFNHR